MSAAAHGSHGIVGVVMLALAASPGIARAQSLADRVATLDDATVELRYAARPGLCGDGARYISMDDGTWSVSRSAGDGEPCVCREGPVRVTLRVVDGRVERLRTAVGEPPSDVPAPDVDLGDVAPQDAADYLIGVARTARDDVGERAVFAATLGEGVVVWPELVRLARNGSIPTETRRSATFWLGQAAAKAVTRELGSIATDDAVDVEVRKHAVFALSRRPRDEAVPALIQIVRSHRHAEVREAAVFWLGRTEDPRAIALFEEILSGG